MRNKVIVMLACALVLLMAIGACKGRSNNVSLTDRDTMYQVSTLQALTAGVFDGAVAVKELKQHGDIGLGTYEGLNGEMIVINQRFFRATHDGSIEEAGRADMVPFASVTWFDSDESMKLPDGADLDQIKAKLDAKVSKMGPNDMYIARVDGKFKTVEARSETPTEPPYENLASFMETHQEEFTFRNVEGTMVCVYFPDYMDGVNTPGWHFHFISKDRKQGGHVFGVKLTSGKAELDKTDSFKMDLPDNEDFQQQNLSEVKKNDIKKVEQGDGDK